MGNRESEDLSRFADMLSAMGTEPRLRIMRLLLSAHPEGMVAGEIGAALEIAGSTLSHHLERIKRLFVAPELSIHGQLTAEERLEPGRQSLDQSMVLLG